MTFEVKQKDQNAPKNIQNSIGRKMLSFFGSSRKNRKLRATRTPVLSKIHPVKPRATLQSRRYMSEDNVSLIIIIFFFLITISVFLYSLFVDSIYENILK